MPAFNYTGGDISHLTPGGAASMTDLQGPLTDVRTALNGNLDEINVPNLSAAFTTWKAVPGGVSGGAIPNQGVGGTFLLPGGMGPNAASVTAVGAAGTAVWAFYFSPADVLANARTTKLRIRWHLFTNNVASAQTYVPGMYPVATQGAASGNLPAIATVGTVITGSTVTFTSPAASSSLVSLSTEFNAPAAGAYCFGFVLGGGMVAGSTAVLGGLLQMRQM